MSATYIDQGSTRPADVWDDRAGGRQGGFRSKAPADVAAASERLDRWIESEQFKGWDPFDALNSPILKALCLDSRRLGQVWIQALKWSPINMRPLLRIGKDYNPKAMGLFLASYQRKYWLTRSREHLNHVRFFADWLASNISAGYHGACWGYNFDWPNRNFYAPRGTPTVVNTAFIGLAFIDMVARPLGQELSREALGVARSACNFLLCDLRRTQGESGEFCFSYTPLDVRRVHNANVLGAWLLAEVASRTSEIDLASTALAAARYTARRQLGDGSWPYGEDRGDRWIDNFHTGYTLVGLRRIAACLNTREFDACISRGYDFWKLNMFLPDGAPKYYPDRLYPIDTHCVAQAVLTFLSFADEDPDARQAARRVLSWSLMRLLNRQGYFDYLVTPWYRIRIPYMRWTQAWMQRALSEWQYREIGLCEPHAPAAEVASWRA